MMLGRSAANFRPSGAARRGLVLAVLATLAFSLPGNAQTPAIDDPEATMLSGIMVVAPARGPAWWKASKGDSVVWILGWPPGPTPRGMNWDQSVLDRRLRGAKAFLAPPRAVVRFPGTWTEPVTPQQAKRIDAIVKARRLPAGRAHTVMAIMDLHNEHRKWANIATEPVDTSERVARRLGIPVVRGAMTEFQRRPGDISATDPLASACLDALLEQIETPASTFQAAGRHWAQGRPAQAIALTPRGWSMCLNIFMPGHSRRMIESQTAAIAKALQTPGKAVAVVPMRQLVAEDGVLARLRAQGYKIADPGQRLRE